MNEQVCCNSKEIERCGNTYNYNHYHCGRCGITDGGNAESIPSIGENGNWYIGGEDTGVKARGEDGKTGPKGEKGDTGADGIQGPVGSFAAMEVLFDGVANQEGNSYQLAKPITEYKCLLIEYGIKYSTNNWGKQQRLIPNPVISNFTFEYSNILLTYFKNNALYEYGAACYFPTAGSMKVGWLAKGDAADTANGVIDTAILKVYGIK